MALPGRALRAGEYPDAAGRDERAAVSEHLPHPLDPNPQYAPKPVPSGTQSSRRPARTTPAACPAPRTGAASRSRSGTFYGGVRASLRGPQVQLRALQHTSALDPTAPSCPAGESWIHPITQGQTFRIVDLEGNQAVDTLFYDAADPTDRYDFQNTIRAQGNIYLTTGSRLMSSRGNALADHRGGHLRAARHARRRLRDGKQHGPLRPGQAPHARLPPELLAGAARLRVRPGKAGHRQQHQLLHERPRHARRAG